MAKSLTTANGRSGTQLISTPGGMADYLQKNIQQIALAGGKAMDPAQMIRLARTMFHTNTDLLNCTPLSILGGVIQAAQLGLELDGFTGAAYLVPFKNKHNGNQLEAQFIPGYRGLMRLARRSGEVTNIVARVVRMNDLFTIELGNREVIRHIPSEEPFDDDPETSLKAVYAFGCIKGADDPQFDYLWKWQVDKIRQAAPGKNSPAWVNHYEEMAKKSCLRRLCKYLPISVAAQRAVTLDEMAESGLSQNLAALVENPVAALPEPIQGPTGEASGDGEQTVAAKFHTVLLESLAMAEDAGLEDGDKIKQVQRKRAQWQADYSKDKAAVDAIQAVAAKVLEGLGAND
jgi:recombination protein RecT